MSAILCASVVCAQPFDESVVPTDNAQRVIESLKLSQETERRVENALAAYEKMKQAGRYVNSISEIVSDKNIQLPIGLKSSNYTLCIEELYSDCTAGEQKMYVKAVCVIPTYRGKSLAFEGTARIDGEKGVGTEGKLELIAPTEEKLGNEGSVVFCEGSSLSLSIVMVSER